MKTGLREYRERISSSWRENFCRVPHTNLPLTMPFQASLPDQLYQISFTKGTCGPKYWVLKKVDSWLTSSHPSFFYFIFLPLVGKLTGQEALPLLSACFRIVERIPPFRFGHEGNECTFYTSCFNGILGRAVPELCIRSVCS